MAPRFNAITKLILLTTLIIGGVVLYALLNPRRAMHYEEAPVLTVLDIKKNTFQYEDIGHQPADMLFADYFARSGDYLFLAEGMPFGTLGQNCFRVLRVDTATNSATQVIPVSKVRTYMCGNGLLMVQSGDGSGTSELQVFSVEESNLTLKWKIPLQDGSRLINANRNAVDCRYAVFEVFPYTIQLIDLMNGTLVFTEKLAEYSQISADATGSEVFISLFKPTDCTVQEADARLQAGKKCTYEQLFRGYKINGKSVEATDLTGDEIIAFAGNSIIRSGGFWGNCYVEHPELGRIPFALPDIPVLSTAHANDGFVWWYFDGDDASGFDSPEKAVPESIKTVRFGFWPSGKAYCFDLPPGAYLYAVTSEGVLYSHSEQAENLFRLNYCGRALVEIPHSSGYKTTAWGPSLSEKGAIADTGERSFFVSVHTAGRVQVTEFQFGNRPIYRRQANSAIGFWGR